MKNLIVIAGSGMYPELVVRGAKAAGVSNVDVLSVRGSTSRATKRAADGVHEIGIGEIAAGIRWIAEQGYDGSILAGQTQKGYTSRWMNSNPAVLLTLSRKTVLSSFWMNRKR